MKDKAIFNICPDEEFFGREGEVESVFRMAMSAGPVSSVYLLGGRKSGKSEILKRVYHKLFWDQNQVVPFYYAVKADYHNPTCFAEDYLGSFARQYLAFLKKAPLLVVEGHSLSRLERMVEDEGAAGLASLLARHREARDEGDQNLILKNAVSAPHLISLYYRSSCQARVFVMLDDFHLVNDIRPSEGGSTVLNEYPELLKSQLAPHLITGPPPEMLKDIFRKSELLDALDVMEIKNLDDEKAAEMLERLCRLHNVKYDKDVVSFAVRLLGGNPFYIRGIVRAGQKLDKGMTSLREFMNIYAYEIMKGGTGLYLSSLVSSLTDGKDRKAQIRALYNYLGPKERDAGEVSVYKSDSLPSSFERMVIGTGDRVLADFVDAVYGMDVKGRSASQVRTEIAGKRLKEGYRLHGGPAGTEAVEELRSILELFNCQRVPRILFQNHDFMSRYGGNGEKVDIARAEDEDTVVLPQIVGCFDDREGTEKTGFHVMEGQGFYDGRYENGYESAWVVGINASIEAVVPENIEQLIDRCNRLRERTGSATMVRWMVGKGGFTDEALKVSKAGGILTSDYAQLRLLREVVEKKGENGAIAGIMPLREFELTIPMASDAELVAARALEEAARRAGFDEDAVSKMKMALIEACINAFEHGMIRSGKISIGFFVEKERMVICVKNEGRGFDASAVPRPAIDEKLTGRNKRGWGIEIMKGLMDEIRFENINEGTKLIMVKYKEYNDPAAKGLNANGL